MDEVQNQVQILVDKNSKGKERDWRGRKISSLKLSEVFQSLDYKDTIVERVTSCAEALRFIKQPDGRLKLLPSFFSVKISFVRCVIGEGL